MNFEEFVPLATRTESKISSAQMDVSSIKTLLKLLITVGTLLDYTKKGVFYSNYTKYDDNYVDLLHQLNDGILELANNGNVDRSTVTDLDFRLFHGLLGTLTESSELAEHLLKLVEDGSVDKAGIMEEYGDSDWYKAIAFDTLDASESVSRTNVINKLRIRYPDKYSDEAAANRNLIAEREKLEQNV